MLKDYYSIYDTDNHRFGLVPASQTDKSLLKHPMECGSSTCEINDPYCDFNCDTDIPTGRTWTVSNAVVIVIVLIVLVLFTYLLY